MLIAALTFASALAQVDPNGIDVAQADFSCISDQGSTSPFNGVPPLEVSCEVVLSDLFTYDTASWRFGDGSEGEGDAITHVYNDVGQFDIRLELEGLRYVVDDTGPAAMVEPKITKYGHVTACGVPFAEFTVEKRAGLLYDVLNRSDFLPGCVDEVMWTVYEGKARGETPIFEAETWEPQIELPDDGQYTFFLDLYGPAGGGAAKLTVDAKYGVDEKLQGSRRWGCDATAGGSAGLLALLGFGLVRRRRVARS